MKEKIEHFVDEVIKNNNYELLDILWTFSYSIEKTAYVKSFEKWKKWFFIAIKRNLQTKYGLKISEIRENQDIFGGFLNSMPDFLSNETFYEDKKLLREILVNKSSKILVQNSKNRLHDLSDLDGKIFSFVLNYIPIRIQDSVKEAEKRKQEDPSYEDKYGFLSDFHVRIGRESGNIVYFEIDPKEWTYIFNLLFDEELKEQRLKIKSHGGSAGSTLFPAVFPSGNVEYSFWQFGDELVKLGIGLEICLTNAKGNLLKIALMIPYFIYEDIKHFKEKLPILENFEGRINEIGKEIGAREVGKEWHLEESEETEVDGEVPESVIEAVIVSDLEVLEEGLELIGNQYSTSVGYIDILCKDKKGNFVVIELKRGRGSHKVVGQIQKYMAWVSENLVGDKQVRGIIVVREYDKGLEYAIKGSKFPIEIKKFGPDAPTEENIRYCDRCGKPNKKSAKYCVKCGQEFWM